MIDYNDHEQVLKIASEVEKLARRYYDTRLLAANAQNRLDLYLAAQMSGLRAKKANLGYETAKIMVLEDAPEEIRQCY